MTTLVRAPDVLRQLATDFAVENAFAFLPHRRAIPVVAGTTPVGPTVMVGTQLYEVTNVLTLCSGYVSVFTAALACAIPLMKANEQLNWLASNEAKMAGWTELTGVGAVTLAIERAGLGYPTVAAAYEAPHGHIGMVMPAPTTDPTGVYVSAAGIVNRHYCRMIESFGTLMKSARYFTHQ